MGWPLSSIQFILEKFEIILKWLRKEKFPLHCLSPNVLLEILALLDVFDLIRLRSICRFYDEMISRWAPHLRRFDTKAEIDLHVAENCEVHLNFCNSDAEWTFVRSFEQLDINGLKLTIREDFSNEYSTSRFTFTPLVLLPLEWHEALIKTEEFMQYVQRHTSHPLASASMFLPLDGVPDMLNVMPTVEDLADELPLSEESMLSKEYDRFYLRVMHQDFPTLKMLWNDSKSSEYPIARFFADGNAQSLYFLAGDTPHQFRRSPSEKYGKFFRNVTTVNLAILPLDEVYEQCRVENREIFSYYRFVFKTPLENFDAVTCYVVFQR